MKRILSALLAAVLALFAAGCGQSAICVSEEKTLPYRITAVLPHDDGTYWTTVANGIRKAGEERSDIDIEIEMPQLNYNVGQMTDLIRKATAAQVDALVVQGNEDKDYCAALCEAQAAGIQVALVDTDTTQIGPHLYIGTNNYEAGEMMGQELVAQAHGQAHNIAILSGSEGYSNLEQRLSGFQGAIASHTNLHIATVEYDNYDSITVLDIIRNLQEQYPEVDTLVCLEGTGGQTIGSNYTAENRPFPLIFAFDNPEVCLQGLRIGSIQAIAAQQPEKMGYEIIQNLARCYADGVESSEAGTIYTDVEILTQDSLQEEAAS
jgi:ribose transport system substrate-binding protein